MTESPAPDGVPARGAGASARIAPAPADASTDAPTGAPARRGPVDPRLLALSRPARRWVVVTAALTALQTVATVVAGVLAGTAVAGLITDPSRGPSAFVPHLSALAAVTLVRGGLAWANTRFGRRASAEVIADVRSRTLRRLALSDPRRVDAAHWRTVLGDGVEGLGPYLTGFLPSLAATVIATPAVLAVVAWLDPMSALVGVVTLPLIPLFMWLVGTLTEGRTRRRLRDVATLSDQLLDLVAGLPTLRAFGRERDPVPEVRRLSAAHRTSTMSVLRIAFLSGFVLEFLATLSVALVAVGIGFRLLDGSMTLAAGLTVLIIIPEVYNPVRAVGTRFHDAQDGLAAMDAILAELSDGTASPAPGSNSAAGDPDAAASGRSAPPSESEGGLTVMFRGFGAEGRDGWRPRDVTGVARPGRVTVLAGPNGSGKSTALLAALGIVTDGVTGVAEVMAGGGSENGSDDGTGTDSGASRATGGVVAGEALWRRTSYVPQRPVLDTALVGDASGMSLGERQRVAVAAELMRGRDLLVLDEPTAHLDEPNALEMLNLLRERADAGATVLLASHDPVVLAAADAVIDVEGAES